MSDISAPSISSRRSRRWRWAAAIWDTLCRWVAASRQRRRSCEARREPRGLPRSPSGALVTRPLRLPAGVRDRLPADAERRARIVQKLSSEFSRWGYRPVVTPSLEYLDCLSRGMAERDRAGLFTMVEPETGELLAVRPDITPQ